MDDMSHWGYVIEKLVHEDEKMRVARARRRKARRGRVQDASGSVEDVARSRRQPPRRGSVDS
jgi:hypothetical protein